MSTDTASSTTASPTTRRWPALVTVVAMASLPFVTLFAQNTGEALQVATVLTWWAVTLGGGLAIVGVAFVLAGDVGRRSAVVVAALLFLVFNFPLVVDLQQRLGLSVSPTVLWVVIALAVAGLAAWLGGTSAVQLFASIVAPMLLLAPLATLVVGQSAQAGDVTQAAGTRAGPGPGVQATDVTLAHKPNIWYFVLDGHGSPDLLRERTNYDPGPFLDHLRAEGFAVPSDSWSNYPFTNLSMSAAMDMEYVYEGRQEPNGGPFFDRLQGNNKTVDILTANGYGYVHAYPYLWSGSKCSGREDVCIGDHGPLDDTQWALASMTPLVGMFSDPDAAAEVAETNDPLHATRQALARRPDGPTFSFIHMLNPHPPLLRDADCNVRDVDMTFSAWGSGPEYGDAVDCLHQRLQVAVDEILAVDEDPVIIIQGDHGPRFGIDWSQEGGVTLEDDMYFSILSAVRLPAACADVAVPDDLSQVNTFRLVFACLTDTEPDLLAYRRFPIHRG